MADAPEVIRENPTRVQLRMSTIQFSIWNGYLCEVSLLAN